MTTVCIWGLGAMGRAVAEIVSERAGYRLVGAISHQVGQDLGEILGGEPTGVTVVAGPDDLDDLDADVCVVTTHTKVAEVAPQILWAVGRGMNVITSAEEMFNARVEQPALAAELDAAAKAAGVSVLGTGVNPGFAMDTLIAFLSTACQSVESVHVTRTNDLSPFGPVVVEAFGLGLSPEQFEAQVDAGTVLGHVGFRGSIAIIAETCGIDVDEVVEELSPILADEPCPTPYGFTVETGKVAGCNQVGKGLRGGELVIHLEHPQRVWPPGTVATSDVVRMVGNPSISLHIAPEISGGAATAAILANVIPSVLDADPGLITMMDLKIPHRNAFATKG